MQGLEVDPRKQSLEATRTNIAPPTQTLRRDEWFSELSSRLGDPSAAAAAGGLPVGSGSRAVAAAAKSTLNATAASALASIYKESPAAAASILGGLQNKQSAEAAAASIRSRRRRNVLAATEMQLENSLQLQRLQALQSCAMAPSVPELALMAAVGTVLQSERAFIARRNELDAHNLQKTKETNWAELDRQRGVWASIRQEHEAAVELACYTYDRAVAARVAATTQAAAEMASALMQKTVEFAVQVSRQRELRRGMAGPIVRGSSSSSAAGAASGRSEEKLDDESDSSRASGSAAFEPDDGAQYDANGIYDLPASIYRDLQVIFSSDYSMSCAIPAPAYLLPSNVGGPSDASRPLARADIDIASVASSIKQSDVALAAAIDEQKRKSAEDAAAADAAVAAASTPAGRRSSNVAASSATVQAAASVAAAALASAAAAPVQPPKPAFDVLSLLTADTNAVTALALVPAAGVRGEPQDTGSNSSSGTGSAIGAITASDGANIGSSSSGGGDAASFAATFEGAQPLLDACALRDYLVSIGAWAAPDLRSAGLDDEGGKAAVSDLERFVIGLCASSSSQFKGGLPSILPSLFAPPPAPAAPDAAAAPAAGGRRGSVAVDTKRGASAAALPTAASPTPTPAVTVSDRFLSTIDADGTVQYRSERDEKIASVIAVNPSHPVLSSPYVRYALTTDAADACDVLGLVIRSIDVAAQQSLAEAQKQTQAASDAAAAATEAHARAVVDDIIRDKDGAMDSVRSRSFRGSSNGISPSTTPTADDVAAAASVSPLQASVGRSPRSRSNSPTNLSAASSSSASSVSNGAAGATAAHAGMAQTRSTTPGASDRESKRDLERVRYVIDRSPPHRFPVQVALVGPPHTGMLTQAIRLASSFNLAVIHPRALLGRAVCLAWPSSQCYKDSIAQEARGRPTSRSRAEALSASGSSSSSSGRSRSGSVPGSHGAHANNANNNNGGGSSSRSTSPLSSSSHHSHSVESVPGSPSGGLTADGRIRRNKNARPSSAGRARTPPRHLNLPAVGLDGLTAGGVGGGSGFDVPGASAPSPLALPSFVPGDSVLLVGNVVQSQDAASNVPPSLNANLPVDHRLVSPLLDTILRDIGDRVLSSPAVIQLEYGHYRSIPAGAAPATVDAHIDWSLVPNSIWMDIICCAARSLARAEVDTIQGWLLVDFPSTAEQAALLEERLTGAKTPASAAAGTASVSSTEGRVSTVNALGNKAAVKGLTRAADIRRAADNLLANASPALSATAAGAGDAVNRAAPLAAPSIDAIIAAPDADISTAVPTSSGGAASTAYWSSLMAPAPPVDDAGMASVAPKFEVTWPHGLDVVLRLDTTHDRVLRRALGWVADLTCISTAAASSATGAPVWSTHAVGQGGPGASFNGSSSSSTSGSGSGLASSPDCPVAHLIAGQLGVDLQEQMGLEAPGSSASAARRASLNSGSRPPRASTGAGAGAGAGSAVSFAAGAGVIAPFLSPAVYHCDAIPPSSTCETVDSFIPIAAPDLSYRPGADGSRVNHAGIDIGTLGASIAQQYETHAASIAALEGFYSGGATMIKVRTWTRRKGAASFGVKAASKRAAAAAAGAGGAVNSSGDISAPIDNNAFGEPSASISIEAVDDVVAGGDYPSSYSHQQQQEEGDGAMRARESSIAGPSESKHNDCSEEELDAENAGATAAAQGDAEDVVNGSIDSAQVDADDDEDYAATAGSGLEDSDNEYDAAAQVAAMTAPFTPQRSITERPSVSAGKAATALMRKMEKDGVPSTAGTWTASRFDTLNENELHSKLLLVLKRALALKIKADLERSAVILQANQAADAEAALLRSKAAAAAVARRGEGVAAAEALAAAGEGPAPQSSDPAAMVWRHPVTGRLAPPPLPPSAVVVLNPLRPATSSAGAAAAYASVAAEAAAVLTAIDRPASSSSSSSSSVPQQVPALALPTAGAAADTSAAATKRATAIVEDSSALAAGSALPPSSASSLLPTQDSLLALLPPPSQQPVSIALALQAQWQSCVNNYAATVKSSMRSLRYSEAGAVTRLATVRRRLREYCARPCPELQVPLTHFQRHWNDIGLIAVGSAATAASAAAGSDASLPAATAATAITSSKALGIMADVDASLRSGSFIPSVGADASITSTTATSATAAAAAAESLRSEALLRLEETIHSMWDGVDARESQALAHLASLKGDGWTAHSQAAVIHSFVALIAAETNRFATSRRLLCDYYSAAEGATLSDFLQQTNDLSAELIASLTNDASSVAADAPAGAASDTPGRRGSVAVVKGAPSRRGSVAAGKEAGKAAPAAGAAAAAGGAKADPKASSASVAAAAGAKGSATDPAAAAAAAAVPSSSPSAFDVDDDALRSCLPSSGVALSLAGMSGGSDDAGDEPLPVAPAAPTLRPQSSSRGVDTPQLSSSPSSSSLLSTSAAALTSGSGSTGRDSVFVALLNDAIADFSAEFSVAMALYRDGCAPAAAPKVSDASAAGDEVLPTSPGGPNSGFSGSKSRVPSAAAGAKPAAGAAAGKPPAAAGPGKTAASGKDGKGVPSRTSKADVTDAPVDGAAAPAAPQEPLPTSEAAKTMYLSPLKRLVGCIVKGMSIADSVTACVEAMAVNQVRARERKVTAERALISTAIADQRSAEATAREEAQKAADAANAAANQPPPEAAPVKGKAGAAAAGKGAAANSARPSSAAKQQAAAAAAAAEQQASSRSSGDAGAGAAPTAPSTAAGQAILDLVPPPKTVRQIIVSATVTATATTAAAGALLPSSDASIASTSSSSDGKELMVDEGLFIALRHEAHAYRNRLFNILRHAAVQVSRIAAAAEASWAGAQADVLRSSLAEGACIEAFGQLARAAIAAGQALPNGLRIEYNADCVAIVVDKSARVGIDIGSTKNTTNSSSSSGGGYVFVLPGIKPLIERGDLLAGDSDDGTDPVAADADAGPVVDLDGDGYADDDGDEAANKLMTCLGPLQIGIVADTLRQAALTFTAGQSAPGTAASSSSSSTGQEGKDGGADDAAESDGDDRDEEVVSPPSALPSHVFVDALTRLGASGALPPPWARAAIAAAMTTSAPTGAPASQAPSSLSSSALHTLADRYKVTTIAAGTAAAAAAAADSRNGDGSYSDGADAVLEDVVDWRYFVACLCLTGPAPDVPGPMMAALATSTSSSSTSVAAVPPSYLGVANGISIRPSLADVIAIYTSAVGADADAGIDASAFAAPRFVPRSVVSKHRFWFEGRGLEAAVVHELQQRSASGSGAGSHAGTAASATEGGWHHVSASHGDRASAGNSVTAAMVSAAGAEAASAHRNAAAVATSSITRSVAAGEVGVKRVLLDTFAVPAGAVIPDPQQLAQQGLKPLEQLIDVGALCSVLAKMASATG